MLKWLKKVWQRFLDAPDPAMPNSYRNINACKVTPPIPSTFDSTPYGHYDHDFLIWAFGEVPALQPSQYYIEAWNKRYGNIYLIGNNDDLATHFPKLEQLWIEMRFKK